MHFHSNDFVTLVCTSDDDSCFTPIDKELAGRLQLLKPPEKKAILVDHRNFGGSPELQVRLRKYCNSS